MDFAALHTQALELLQREGEGLIWLGRTSVVPQATVSRQPAPAASATEPSRRAHRVRYSLIPATGDNGLKVRAEGLARMALRCSPYHTTSALYPVITHIEPLLQSGPQDDPPALLEELGG